MSTNPPYEAGPSMLPLTYFTFNSQLETVTFDHITPADVVFQSEETWENFGTEDPRVAYRAADQTYYMMYSAVEQFVDPPDKVVSMLSLATTKTP